MMRFFDPRDALAHVPAFRGATAEVERELEGLSNRSFLVRQGAERFVLRLDAPQTALFDVDRITELTVLDRAARAGIAPAILFADPGTGILVTRFLRGRTLEVSDLDDSGTVDAVAALLRRVHGIGRCGRRLDLPAAAQRYAKSIDDGRETAEACISIIAGLPEPGQVTVCHNDVVLDNIVSGDGLWLIDWEYARDNDPLFDLATLVAYHDLGPGAARALLSAYCGGADAEAAERLAALVRGCDALHWLWLAARATVQPGKAQREQMSRLAERVTRRTGS